MRLVGVNLDIDSYSFRCTIICARAPEPPCSLLHSMVPEVVRIDPGRLSQIVVNLLTNAAKFTQRGSIRVTCTVVACGDALQPITMKIAVQDTGESSK